MATKEVFSKKIATIQRNSEKVYMDILQTKTLPAGNFSNKLAYTPRTYDTMIEIIVDQQRLQFY